ncbi:hypothetical protein BT67DRAFT_449773 [Trichocladium antarcticum]|uniref:Fungal-type protein kinase domain-containing protein n=1 Tax=Trichocladium antarcticum TaxID=1450529 RepID=A0AAN6ZE66_9PEZI|nr:hypothetical protein BT67DRAFT_449773 [Trichocladium antarcticum]
MADQPRSKIIEDNPIRKDLDTFRALFNIVYTDRGIASAVSDDFDLDCIKPLLQVALADDYNDALVWDRVYDALRNTGSFANSSEHRKYMDNVLREELGIIYAGLRDFYDTYFGSVPHLATASRTFFDDCLEGSGPLFDSGWIGWPKAFAERHQSNLTRRESTLTRRRRPLAKLDAPIAGSIAERKIDDTRRFAFDRLGGIASDQFDINKDGLRFRFIEVKRDSTIERLVLDKLMKRIRCVAGRATTCWKAHQRDDKGVLLSKATSKGVVRVARHYYHETVRVRNAVDDIQGNVRKGVAGTKRSSTQTSAPLPSSKRHCSASSTKAGNSMSLNRVHRRVILYDYGIPIYKAGSRQAMLSALADYIEGHASLRQKAGLLHRDISISNLIRVSALGAKGKTGTRAFMAIGALLGEQHSFMHDLESFFWVLFWICIHCDGPGEGKILKKGEISDEGDFIKSATEKFKPYYKPLVPWVNRLRRIVFPNERRWVKEDSGLYVQMREILEEARKDPRVAAGG